MLFFFATIGAGAGSLSALWSTGWLTAFIAIQLSVHLAVIVFGGYVVAGLPMQVMHLHICHFACQLFALLLSLATPLTCLGISVSVCQQHSKLEYWHLGQLPLACFCASDQMSHGG